jgi:hypothetical protein
MLTVKSFLKLLQRRFEEADSMKCWLHFTADKDNEQTIYQGCRTFCHGRQGVSRLISAMHFGSATLSIVKIIARSVRCCVGKGRI